MYSYRYHHENGCRCLLCLPEKVVKAVPNLTRELASAIALRLRKLDIGEFSEAVRNTGLQIPNYCIPSMMAEFNKLAAGEKEHFMEMTPEKFERFLFVAALLAKREGRLINKQSSGLLEQMLLFDKIPQLERPLVTTYGIEMEFFGLNRSKTRLLKHINESFDPGWQRDKDPTIMPDDKTKGIELVSPILNSDNMHRLYLYTALLSAMGAKAPVPCALHVHAGLTETFNDRDFRRKVIKQLVINYAAIEDDLAFLDSKLVNNYKDAFADPRNYAQAIIASNLEHEGVFPTSAWACHATLLQPSGRRQSKINYTPFHVYGTAEFRHHPGTVDPQEIFSWLDFINNLIDFSSEMVRGDFPRFPNDAELSQLKIMAFKLKSAHEPKKEIDYDPDKAAMHAVSRQTRRATVVAGIAGLTFATLMVL